MRVKTWFRADGYERSAPWRVFWTALILRILYMTLAHTWKIRPYEDHFQFGWEAGRIARALATGYGYADPFSDATIRHTGPTAWLPPLYPLLLAGIFKVFGVYTAVSAWVALAVNCVMSAATAMLLWELSWRSFGRRCALWAGWLWAVYPAAWQYAVKWEWEMTLTCWLFVWVLVLCLRLRGIGDEEAGVVSPPDASKALSANKALGRWCLFGLLWGMIALSNSSLLLFLPFSGLWILWGRWSAAEVRNAVVAGLIWIACITPWTVRNYRVFHTFVPLRGNLGVEMYLGNGPGSTGWLMAFDHPGLDPQQINLYVTLGEVRYSKMRGELADAYVRTHRAHYWAITAKRVYFFWAGVPHPDDHAWYYEGFRMMNFEFGSLCGLLGLGLAVQRRKAGAWLYFGAFLLLPVTYYLVTVHARFRHPLEPLCVMLGVFLFQSAVSRHRAALQKTD